MNDEQVGDLIERLISGHADAAWSEFLKAYSPLIMHVVRRYESDSGRATDGFVHVCAALSDDRFRRLRSFRMEGPARFRTWLMAVVANLCVDWRRKDYRRYRPLRAVARLPQLEQWAYRYLYVRGMSRAECLHALEARFPGLTDRHVAEINARLFALLTPLQRWQLSTRTVPSRPLDDASPADAEDRAAVLEETGPGPAEVAQKQQEADLLHAAMARLPPQQRLLLRLRYEQDLTLAEVARLTGHADPFRAKRQIEAALAALATLMNAARLDRSRKTR
ncbi:MAG TPA: sigma-70 family RNA polymerase sigma factor [Steroidobacteraceae bacterium]|nr:sigma-70 family RNA polymerase sigma factor [Steroidobacteraceae bacterium]